MSSKPSNRKPGPSGPGAVTPNPLIVAVDEDKCAQDAIHAALACARSRTPRVSQVGSDRVPVLEMCWTRLDSKRKEASIRLGHLYGDPDLDPDRARRIAVELLEASLTSSIDLATLLQWRDALADAAVHAADAAVRTGGDPSHVDHCHATAPSPWQDGSGYRSSPDRGGDPVRIMDQSDLLRRLPDLPAFALLRSGDFNNKGGARLSFESLHGSSPFTDRSAVEMMRIHLRFAHVPRSMAS